MRLAANDDKMIETGARTNVRDERLDRARRLLRPARAVTQNNRGPLLASAGLAGAALLLASLVTGVGDGQSSAPKAPTSGSDLAPTLRPLRSAVPSGHADFELSASSGVAPAAPADATPPVRDAVLIGTESEVR